MNGYTFLFLTLLLAILAMLVYMAGLGSVTAIVVLAILLTILLISLGAGIVLAVNRMQAAKEQQAFVNNAKENLAMMAAMQNVQNKQNAGLLQQLGQVSRLPLPHDPAGMLTIDEGIFQELDQ